MLFVALPADSLIYTAPSMVYPKDKAEIPSNSHSEPRVLQGFFSRSIWHSSNEPCSTSSASKLHPTLASFPSIHSLAALGKICPPLRSPSVCSPLWPGTRDHSPSAHQVLGCTTVSSFTQAIFKWSFPRISCYLPLFKISSIMKVGKRKQFASLLTFLTNKKTHSPQV